MKKLKLKLKLKKRPPSPLPVAASHHSEFPIDVVSLILVRLPVKTLSRFRCVCKPWYSLISSPHFQNQHHLRSQRNPLLLLTRECRYNKLNRKITLHLSTYNLDTAPLNKFSVAIRHDGRHHPRLIQSCRGLVCLLSDSAIFLCNPSTEEINTLPPPTPQSYHCIGFGFAAEEFKVVRLFNEYDDHRSLFQRCQVFTLGTWHWREARRPPPFDFGWLGAPLLHGSLHLLPSGFKYRRDSNYIAAFDLENEEYKGIQLPEYHYSAADIANLEYMNLTELGGALCLTVVVWEKLELWLLKDYHKGEWMKQYTIDPCELGGYNIFYIDSRYALAILDDGKLLVNLSGPHETTELVCYDPKSKSVTRRMGSSRSAAIYVESLFSLGSR